MHSDVHLTLHHLTAAELRQTAAGAAHTDTTPTTPRTPIRVRLGWKLVEFGLKLAAPGASRAALACRSMSV
ncbi:hypothetical protein AB0C52_01205 [Streptomyces sp. NPDC048717]|uniref:hypothetical protein n=1 Tax=Streptomyces sp. NPDC048717 TaxID=3154928 RepID=UPI00342B9367